MSVISGANNSFLVLSYIGTGEKYGDAPDFIYAAFESFSLLPSIIDTIILPKPAISVLALVVYNLPTESLVEPLPNPFSYFTKENPNPTNSASIQLLKLLPLLPVIILEKIIQQASQAWLDGYKSIIYAHTSHSQTKSFSIVPMPRNQLATHYTLLHFLWRMVTKEKQ